ncbi:MAG: phosphate ABC transporter substrate-binding protein [Bernardetiaceae bacterium]
MKRFLLLIAALLFSTSLWAQNTLEVAGSTTLFPLIKELSSLYMDDNKGVTVNVRPGGSGTGIKSLNKNKADIAMASRLLTTQEEQEMPTIRRQVIAYDALSVIVHPSNPVDQLTMEQIRDIFSGKIKNWKEVGGRNETIQLFNRDKSSGTYGFMLEQVLEGQAFSPDALELESNSGIVQQVSKNRAGIGYIGLAYAEDIVRTVAVKKGAGAYVKPTFKNAMEKKYPIIRPLSLFYLPSKEDKVKKFIDFAMSSIGQKLAAYEGYIPASF